MSSFEGKVIAITGGASGIGLSTAKLLLSRGAKVSLADIQGSALESAAKEIRSITTTTNTSSSNNSSGSKNENEHEHEHGDGSDTDNVMTFVLDVRDRKKVDKWIERTVERFGRLDGAANMAGVTGRLGHFTADEIDDADWEFVVGVNLTGLMYCQRAELKAMKASSSSSSNGGGAGCAIVNAASIAGLQGRIKNSAYSASKHGVIGLTRSAAKEMAQQGIRINAIAPGSIETPMIKAALEIAGEKNPSLNINNDSSSMKRLGKAIEVANLIAFLLSDEASFITGAVMSVDGGWNC